MTSVSISDINDSRLAPYRHLKRHNDTRDSAYFIAEGDKVVERLLSSSYETASVLLAQQFTTDWLSKIPEHVPAFVVPGVRCAQAKPELE
jgi:hypothetical protein